MCFCVWVCVRVYVCLHTHAQLRWTFNKRMVGYKAYLLVFNAQPFKKVIADMQNYENANFHFISITDVWAHPGKREAGLLDLWKCDLRRLSPHPHWYHLAYRGDQHRLSVEYYCLWSGLLFQLSIFYVYLCVCIYKIVYELTFNAIYVLVRLIRCARINLPCNSYILIC